MKLGMELPVPSRSIAIKFSSLVKRDGHLPYRYVLAFRADNLNQPYITWCYVEPPNSTGSTPYCVHGHYFGDLQDALTDYNERMRNG